MLYRTYEEPKGHIKQELIGDSHDCWAAHCLIAAVAAHAVKVTREFAEEHGLVPNVFLHEVGAEPLDARTPTEEQFAAAKALRSEVYGKIIEGMTLLANDAPDYEPGVIEKEQEAFDLLAKYWKTLWT
jgi:hypothetical protein